MEKNSFSLFETILTLIIIFILVSGFSKFTYFETASPFFINDINTLLLTNESHENIHMETLGYEIQNSTVQFNTNNQITHTTYESKDIKLQRYQLNTLSPQNISFIEVKP